MDHFNYVDGWLHAEGVPLTRIAEAVGTPAYVYSTDRADERLAHLFESIGDLEAACARYAAMRMTEAQRIELREVHTAGFSAMQAKDVVSYHELNLRLHDLILEGSHNPELIEVTRNLQKRANAYRRNQFMQIARVAASYEEHCGIVDAVLTFDAANAYRMMRAHVHRAHDAASVLVGSREA